MNDTKTTTTPSFSLPDMHPAKPMEEVLRAAAPRIALSVYEWLLPKPPRAPLIKRVTLHLADRLTRTGRALRAFVWAYQDTLDVLHVPPFPSSVAEEAAQAPAPPPPPAASHVNGIARPQAAEGTSP